MKLTTILLLLVAIFSLANVSSLTKKKRSKAGKLCCLSVSKENVFEAGEKDDCPKLVEDKSPSFPVGKLKSGEKCDLAVFGLTDKTKTVIQENIKTAFHVVEQKNKAKRSRKSRKSRK